MPRFSFQVGCITMTVKHLVRRSSGAFYFRLGIPQDLREFYKGKREHYHSLKTRIESEAVKSCVAYTLKYEQEFKQLRSTGERTKAAALLKSYDLAPIPIADQPRFEDLDNPGNPYNQLMEDLAFKYGRGGEYLPADPHEDRAVDILHGEEKLTLAEVEADALKAVVVKTGRDMALKRRRNDIARHFSSFTKLLPTTQLDLIRRKQVQDAVDQMLDDGSQTGTVKKRLGAVRLYVKTVIATYELNIKNPFDDVIIRGGGLDVKEKPTYSPAQLVQVKRFIWDKSELTTAQVLGLQVDTGTRCGEIGGILLADICLGDDVPHMVCRVAENRDIKSAAGSRRVPLAGLSLEIAKKVKAGASDG